MCDINCIDKITDDINEIIDFYKRQQKVVDLWQYDSVSTDVENTENAVIVSFHIPKGNFASITSEDEIKNRQQLMEKQAEVLRDEIGNILDDNQDQVNGDILTALDMIYGYIERFTKVYIDKSHKFLKTDMESDEIGVSKKVDNFYETVKKTFAIIFDESLPAIYRGIQMTHSPLYDIVLASINNFLKNVGIFTMELKLGEKINTDFCSYADEEVAKETENIELDDVLYEIKQYPYFIDEYLLSLGKACAWRFVK